MHAPDRPVVDPRTADDLAARLRSRTRETLPDWRPSPDGDVGTALQQVASRFAAQVVDRINRVPVYAMRGFLESAGMAPLPAQPAQVTVAFKLRDGAAATVVPAGTQLEAPATARRPAVVFETVRDLTLLPAAAAAVEVLDPVWDRVTDVLSAIPASDGGVPAFTGQAFARHDLLLTSFALAALEEMSAVELSLSVESAGDASATIAMVDSLVLSGVRDGDTVPCTGLQRRTAEKAGRVTSLVRATTGPVDGVALALPGPLADHACAERDLLRKIELVVSTAARSPLAAAVDGAPVDTSTAFLPFGQVPGAGSELAICDPLLAHEGATVTLSFTLDGGTPDQAALTWEWHDGTTWQPLSGVTDNTSLFSKDGTVSFSSPGCREATAAGLTGYWVRVRITAGGYGLPARYVPKKADDLSAGMVLEAGTGHLDAPRVLGMTVAARLRDSAPTSVRRTHLHTDPALDRPVAAALDGLAGPDGTTGQTLLIGLEGEIGNSPVSLHATTTDAPPAPRGTQLPDTGPRALTWEYLAVTGWRPLTVTDGTDALSRSGVVSFVAPHDLADQVLGGHPPLRWVRARATTEVPLSGGPRLAALALNAVDAVAGESVAWEALGTSDGRAQGQVRLARTPVLPGQELYARELEPPRGDELIALMDAEGASAVTERIDPTTGRTQTWVRWQEVPSFTASGPEDRHYTVNRETGVVRFGGDGRGLAAPRGTTFAARYRFGGGAAGNVGAGEVNRMRTAIAAVAMANNPVPGDGGSDREPMEVFERRAPAALRHRGRAITAADVLWHTRELAGTRVARCLVPAGVARGEMAVVVVPDGPGPAPSPSSTLLALLEEELSRRLAVALALRGGVRVQPPSYRPVAVVAEVEATRAEQSEMVKARVLSELDRFLHALTGGPEGTGWPLGRAVYESEIAERLGGVDGVRTIRSLTLTTGALTQQIAFRSAVLLPLGLPVGSPVALSDGTTVWTLDEPVPPGSAADAVTARGITEGDLLHIVVDGTASGTTSVGDGLRAVELEPTRGAEVPLDFPPGSVLVDDAGTAVGVLRRTARTGASALALQVAPVTQRVFDDQRLTLVHPVSLRAERVQVDAPTGTGLVLLVGDDTGAVVPGATLGLAGHPLRVPVGDVRQRTRANVLVATRTWGVGDPIQLAGADRLADVAQVREIDDVAHLDRGALASSGTHVIRMIQGEVG